MTLSARRAGAADLSAVRAITEAAYAEYLPEFGDPPVPMTEDYAPHLARGETWLVSRDGEEVAVAVLEPGPDHLGIFSLAVRPDRKGGIGRFMLALAEERARVLGLPELRLFTNDRMRRNIRIYGEAGFTETGRAENPVRPGWISVHMSKRVDHGVEPAS